MADTMKQNILGRILQLILEITNTSISQITEDINDILENEQQYKKLGLKTQRSEETIKNWIYKGAEPRDIRNISIKSILIEAFDNICIDTEKVINHIFKYIKGSNLISEKEYKFLKAQRDINNILYAAWTLTFNSFCVAAEEKVVDKAIEHIDNKTDVDDYKSDDINNIQDLLRKSEEFQNTITEYAKTISDVDIVKIINDSHRTVQEELSIYGKKELSNNLVPKAVEFVGRKIDIANLNNMMNDNRIVYIQGMGGIGKTELMKYIYGQYESDKSIKLCWITFNKSFKESLVNAFIQEKHHDANLMNYDTKFNSIINDLNKYQKDQLIVFIDNYDIIYDCDFEFFVNNLEVKIIISTRRKRYCKNEYYLVPLNQKECRELFYKNFKYNVDDEIIDEFLKKINRHTLTIKRFARISNYLLKYTIFDDFYDIYLYAFKENHMRMDLLDELVDDEFIEDNDVLCYKYLKNSFNLIQLTDQEKNALVRLTYICRYDCDMDFVKECITDKEITLLKLEEKAWIDINVAENIKKISIHPIIVNVVRNNKNDDQVLTIDVIKLLCIKMRKDYLRFGSYDKPISKLSYVEYIENLFIIIVDTKYENKEDLYYIIEFCILSASICKMIYLVDSMEKYVNYALDLMTNYQLCVETKDNRFISELNELLAYKYYFIEDFVNAIKFNDKSYKIRQNELNSSQIECNLDVYGMIFSRQRDYEKALSYEKKALDIRVERGNSLDKAISYNNIGVTSYYLERFKDAEEYLLKSIEIREREYNDKDHLNLAYCYNTLGLTYTFLNDYDKALEYIKKSLNIRKIKLGEMHPHTILLVNNVGLVYSRMDNYRQAIKNLTKALAQRKTVLNKDHTDISTTQKYLAEILIKVGEFHRALKYLYEALDIRKRKAEFISKKAFSTLYELINIAYLMLGEYEKAYENLKIEKEYLTESSKSFNERWIITSLYYKKQIDLNDTHIEKSFEYYIKGIISSLEVNYNDAFINFQKALELFEEKSLYYSKSIIYEKVFDLHITQNDTQQALIALRGFRENCTECELVKEKKLIQKLNSLFQRFLGTAYQLTNILVEGNRMKYIEKVIDFIDRNLADTGYYINEDMKKHTSFKTGGTADILIESRNIYELQLLLKYILKEQIPYIVIGRGSNIVVGDKGIRDIVIKIDKNLCKCVIENEKLEAEAGAALIDISKEAQRNSLSGLEFACGIPGTVGGAVFMNAGAYGGEIKDILEEVLVLTLNGDLVVKKANELELGYRSSIIQANGDIIIKAKFNLRKASKEDIQNDMDELTRKREQSQPLEFPSAGSTFKRPTGHFTGKLIQDANLRGYKIGGAQVSLKHAGFIINAGNATSSDIINLVRHIQTEVKRLFGVELETEVKLIGEF